MSTSSPNPPPPIIAPLPPALLELVQDMRVIPFVRIYKPDYGSFLVRPTFGMKYDVAVRWAEKQIECYPRSQKSWLGPPDYKFEQSRGILWDLITAFTPLGGNHVVVIRD